MHLKHNTRERRGKQSLSHETLAEMSRALCGIVLSMLAFTGLPYAAAANATPDADQSTIIAELVEKLDARPILALCEHHGNETEHGFIRALIEDPQFTDRVDDIVVEWATATHQAMIDRYIAGEDVSMDDLARAWRDVPAVHMPWEYPVYPRFFEHVRNVNRRLAAAGSARRLRVLAGDPPIDWSKINSFEQLMDFYNADENDRDLHMAGVIRREVLDRGRRALVLAGNGHLTRRNLWEAPSPRPSPDTTTVRLERSHPGSTTVVLFLDRALLEGTELGVRLDGKPTPQLRAADARVFKGIPAGRLTTIRLFNVPPEKALAFPGLSVSDIGNAVLHLAPRDQHRTAVFGVDHFTSMDLSELNRRRTIAKRGPVTPENFIRDSAEITAADGRFSEALPLWRWIVEQEPNAADVHAGLAQTLVGLERRQEAYDAYTRAIELGQDVDEERVAAWREQMQKLASPDRP